MKRNFRQWLARILTGSAIGVAVFLVAGQPAKGQSGGGGGGGGASGGASGGTGSAGTGIGGATGGGAGNVGGTNPAGSGAGRSDTTGGSQTSGAGLGGSAGAGSGGTSTTSGSTRDAAGSPSRPATDTNRDFGRSDSSALERGFGSRARDFDSSRNSDTAQDSREGGNLDRNLPGTRDAARGGGGFSLPPLSGRQSNERDALRDDGDAARDPNPDSAREDNRDRSRAAPSQEEADPTTERASEGASGRGPSIQNGGERSNGASDGSPSWGGAERKRSNARRDASRSAADLREPIDARSVRARDLGIAFRNRNGYLMISDVSAGGPLEGLGFRPGDDIYTVNGARVRSQPSFVRHLFTAAKERVSVVVYRSGQYETIYVEPHTIVEQVASTSQRVDTFRRDLPRGERSPTEEANDESY